MTATAPIDPFTATGAGERMDAYLALARTGPVHRVRLPIAGLPAWLVTGRAEVRQVLGDDRFVKAPATNGRLARELAPEHAPGLTQHMLSVDGTEHARLRRLVGAAFTARRVAALAPRIQQIADGLLDAMDAAVEGAEPVELIGAFAAPLPMSVICELIGVPEEDRADYRRWSEILIAGGFADPGTYATVVKEEVEYARALVERKRREPADDLLSALVAVRDSGDLLTDDELTSMMFLLTVAGHETTVNLIGNGVLALATHPEQAARLRAEPALMASAVEELLRYEGPVQVPFPLLATATVEIGGVEIAAGDIVVPALLSANRDPDHTPDPDTLDLGRSPNSHVAFGHGIHHCLGAPLARLEGRIALTALLERYPDLRLATPPDDLTWRPNVIIHGLTALTVRLR
jgi:cytochrome P450